MFLAAYEFVQSEEARLKFDKEPGHDKLKVSVLVVCIVDWQTDMWCRRKPIRSWNKSSCTTILRRRILVGKLFGNSLVLMYLILGSIAHPNAVSYTHLTLPTKRIV